MFKSRGMVRTLKTVRLPTAAAALLLTGCSIGMPGAADSGSLGRTALRNGDFAAAKNHFEAAIRSNPRSEESQGGLLETLRLTGAYEEAEKSALEFLKTNGSSARLVLEKARTEADRGRNEEAEHDLRRCIDLVKVSSSPLRLTAMKELAKLQEGTGHRKDADSLWDQILEEYHQGRVRGSAGLGAVAVAAWHRGFVRDAKDIFIDATTTKSEGEVSLETLADFGYLFLEKYDASDATSVFRDCLKINKSYPDALVGIALAKRLESSSGDMTYAKTALVINSNHVSALALLAQLLIEEEDFVGASKQVEHALSVNPASLEALSLKAVCSLFQGDSDASARTEQSVLRINPSYGRFYHTLAENLVMRRKYREAVEAEQQAVRLEPNLWTAHAGLGINLMRIGDIAGGRVELQRAFDGDPFNVWAYNTLDLLDQMDKFVRIKSDHFVYLMAKEDEASLSQYAPKIAEEAYQRMTSRYSFQPGGPLQVEIFPDHGGFAVRTLGLPGLGALGVCFGKVVAIDSPRARKAESFNWGSTLWHELAHVITLQMTNHNIPRWYSEGLSVYEEHRARPGWGDDLTISFVKAYKGKTLLKVNELNMGMMHPHSPEQIGLSYYQAMLFCELIEEKFGFEKIRESLKLFAQNKSSQDVFRETLGWDPATLESEYSRFVDDRVRSLSEHFDFSKSSGEAPHPMPVDSKSLSSALARNPEDFMLNLQMGTRLHDEKSDKEAETYLKKAQGLFPEFVGPGSPYQILSDMYLEQNRDDDALAELLGWVRYDETTAAPLVRAARIYLKREDWVSAAKMLELSVYVQPYDPQTYVMLGEAAGEAGDWSAAKTAYRVLVDLNPPDPAGAHFSLARSWLALGNKGEAKREVLKALEIAPTFDKAQKMLLTLSGAEP